MSTVTENVAKNLDLTRNEPLKSLVYQAFRKTIILGEIPAGVRINEKEFAEEMNISRTPIRHAMQTLVSENLVAYQPGIGNIVKGINVADAHEIYDIRKALDILATTTAMKKMTPEDFEELRTLLEDTHQLNEEGDVDLVLRKFSDFNQFIYQKSQMLRLESIVTKLRDYLVYFRDIAIKDKERRDRALHEHWLIYQGMTNQNKEQIELIIHEHLDTSLSFIIKEMEQYLNDTTH
ncbi:GntR family transcriptional regulator [Vagococcus sp. BWB3-3]|uniref:GntR family transcriptional regulator n=1 Tax=Vagococcus allomyrinae TaxID=2794353 RepID=A0A940P8W8_9ENTE|nr:GntR family transcriptional regulator [Vagococcus allomyrinae]MBP1043220.1 GntR family transcriptional regulator [Vagococcus allomyrinae]